MKYHFLRNFFVPGCFLFLLFYLILFPAQAFPAACNGLDLWFHTLLPSLLPFCILSNILILSGIIPKLLKPFQSIFQLLFGVSIYGAYTLVLGLLCGYPMGAKIIGDLYRKKKINTTEGNYLLTISNHVSPMFITTYVALHTFENTISIAKTCFILYLSAFITSLLFRRYFSLQEHASQDVKTVALEFDHYTSIITIETIDEAIFNGFETITKLGGYVILFSICSSMIQQIFKPFPTLQWFLPGITELSTGMSLLAKTTLSLQIKYIFALTFMSFGGFSTIAQTKGMLTSTPFSIYTYIIGKIVHALCTFVLAILFFVF